MSRFPGDLLLGRRFKWPPVTGHRAVVTGRIVGNCISGGSGLAAAAASARASKHRKQDPLLLTIEASSWGLQLGEGFLLHYWTQKITIFVVVLMIQFSLDAAWQGRPPPALLPVFLAVRISVRKFNSSPAGDRGPAAAACCLINFSG